MSDFFEVLKKPKNVARKITGKCAKIGRLNPLFHGFVDLGLLYRSVKERFKTEHFSSLSRPVSKSSVFGDFSEPDFLGFQTPYASGKRHEKPRAVFSSVSRTVWGFWEKGTQDDLGEAKIVKKANRNGV